MKKHMSRCLRWAVLLSIAMFSISAHAADSAEAGLLKHISKAQSNLNAVEKRVVNERRQLSARLNTLEQEVLALREQTAVTRRLADEKTLSLSQLEARLDSWRQQQVYQQNLLRRFLQQHALHGSTQETQTNSPSLSEQVSSVVRASEQFELRFFPSWSESSIVTSSGQIVTAPSLGIGPVTWYWDEQAGKTGLASQHNSGENLYSDALLDGGDSSALAKLRTQNLGEIIFDPTLNRAVARKQHGESLFEHIAKGGLWAIPILLFAIFAFAIASIKVSQLWRLPKLVRFTPVELNAALQGHVTEAKGMQKVLLNIGITSPSPRQRDDQLFVQLQEDKYLLERWIGAIAITAAVAPLLGLLGTVSGMIETFKMMTLFGSGDPEVVSGGIAQALVTTEMGLVVAIPALILNAVLSRRAKSYYNELESFAILISKSDEQENSETPLTSETAIQVASQKRSRTQSAHAKGASV